MADSLTIATWNVNSIAVRLPRLLAFLQRHRPTVVCLQELKGLAVAFPHAELATAGYTAVVLGQKAYNGVAILALSATPPTAVTYGLDDGVDDPQARLVAATVAGIRVINVYVPNGSAIDSEKYAYKLAWLARLRRYLAAQPPALPLCVVGDFNVAPRDLDIARPADWADGVLCTPAVRCALTDLELVDLGQQAQPEGGVYTWWDYRKLGFATGNGLRIDLLLASPALAGRCTAVQVDSDERRGVRPSDHAPVIGQFRWP